MRLKLWPTALVAVVLLRGVVIGLVLLLGLTGVLEPRPVAVCLDALGLDVLSASSFRSSSRPVGSPRLTRSD